MRTEINPQETTRATAFELWMSSPMPMVTLVKTLDVPHCHRSTRFCRRAVLPPPQVPPPQGTSAPPISSHKPLLPSRFSIFSSKFPSFSLVEKNISLTLHCGSYNHWKQPAKVQNLSRSSQVGCCNFILQNEPYASFSLVVKKISLTLLT